MAQYRNPNPFDARFALPANVLAEPPGRGTIVTAQLPRKTFETPGYIPQAWRAGFDVPKYIRDEPLGRGAAVTQQLRRKTIPTLIPGSLGDSGGNYLRPGFPGDPIKQYGQRVGELIMGTIHQVPTEFRKTAVESVLKELEPGLPAKVNTRANEYKAKGMDAKSALQAAISSSVSEGFAKEIIKIGKTGKVPMKSLAGLGSYPEAYDQALEGIWDSITGAVSAVGSGIKTGVRATGSGISTAASWTGGKVASGAKTAYGWGGTVLGKIKSLTCVVLKSPLSDVAVGAAAGSFGAPPQIATVGKQLVQGAICPPGQVAVPTETLTDPGGLLRGGLPSWALPVGVGAAGLLAFMLLRK